MEQTDLLTTINHGQKQAEIYLFQGNLTQAFHAIQSVLEVAPPSAETLKILGNIQQKQGRLIEAKNSYLQAIELYPDFAPAHANLGSIYALQNQWEEAIQYYQQAI
ncbi:MAG: tetratricopeptide repeat protein, partial [Microcoleaceae cyanobacterium]